MIGHCGRWGRRWVLTVLAAAFPFWLGAEGSASAAQAITVCPSGCSYSTIQGAIDAASSGATIRIANGTHDEHPTIPGASGASALLLWGGGRTIVDGTNSGIVVSVSPSASVTLRNLTITGGSGSGNPGPGIQNNGGTVTLENSAVSDNTGTGIGNLYGNALTLYNSTVSSNKGAGIFNNAGLALNNSRVTDNTSDGDGGGIISFFGTLKLNNSKISGNTGLSGGGMFDEFGFG